MADAVDTIVFDVKLDAEKVEYELNRLNDETKNLRENQKYLNKAYQDGEITFAQYTKALTNNKNQVRDNEKQMKGLSAQLKALDKNTNEYTNTLNGQRAKLRDMQAAYAALDKTERESRGGQKFLQEIHQQSEAVKSMEKSIGDTRRNVGNYEEAFRKAGGGVAAFGGQLKAFFLNPWLLLFTGIATAVKTLVDAFRASEDRMKTLERATAPLRAALQVVQNVFQSIAQYLTQYVVLAFQKVADGIGWVARTIDKIGKRFGKDFGLAEALDAMTTKTNQLTEAQQKLQERERKWVVEEAKINKQIAEYQAQIADKANLSAEERLALIDKVAELEKRRAAEERAQAKERVRLMELEASMADNDADANDALAQAKADVINADAKYEETLRSLNKQRSAAIKEIEAEAKAEETATDKSIKDAETAAKEKQKLDKSALDVWLAQEMARIGKDKEWTQEAYDVKRQYFTDLLALYDENSVEYNNVLTQMANYDAQYTENHRKQVEQQKKDAEAAAKAEKDAKQKAYQQTLGAAKGVFGSLGELAEQNAETEEDAAKKKKAFALGGLVVDQASAIGSSVAATAAAIEGATKAAAQTGIAAPFTTPAFIAEMVGIVASAIASAISGIVQAKQILSGAFAGGGVIGGYTSNPSPIDNTYAHVGTGEMVLNARQQKQLFEAANGAPIGGFDYNALAQAMASMPAPVMDYREFTTFEDKVLTFNEIASV